VQQGYFSYRSGLEAAEQLLGQDRPPTAIFASNDDMAAAVVSVAHRHGLDVPRDLSVVGFDDTSAATTVWPELTTIHQPIASMADSAIDVLLRDIRRNDRTTRLLADPRCRACAGHARFRRAAQAPIRHVKQTARSRPSCWPAPVAYGRGHAQPSICSSALPLVS
jgi:LacI family transcriptional regulator